MVIKEKLGTLSQFKTAEQVIDYLDLEWYEVNRRLLHKKTGRGKEIVLKSLKGAPQWTQDDVIHEDNAYIIALRILPCTAIVVHPATFREMAALCYEIGNQHLPLYYQEGTVMVPYEAPLFRWLEAAGFRPEIQERQLLHGLNTTVAPHGNQPSLFSKILQLTASSHD